MRAIKYRELKRLYEGMGAEAACRHLLEALTSQGGKAPALRPEDFSIRELAEVCMGDAWVKSLDPRRSENVMHVRESDGVDSTAFSNITGQIVYSKILQAYQNPAFWASQIVETIPTRLSGERIPGMTQLKDEVDEVHEAMPYLRRGFGEDYIDTPATVKRGEIVPVTKEAVFFDRTGLILQRASAVGEVLGLNKEKRVLDVILGITNNYKWLGTDYNTYYASGSNWINQFTEELVDWTDIDAAEKLFTAMVDPHTGEPISINYADAALVVMPDKRHTARQILNATELRTTTESSAYQRVGPNTLTAYYLIDNTALAKARLVSGASLEAAAAAKYWFFGNFRKAFAYMENWPITVTQAPTNAEAEFERDIVAQYKASERGVAAVMDPRWVVRSTGAGS